MKHTNARRVLHRIQERLTSAGVLTRISKLLTTLGVMTHEHRISGTYQLRTEYKQRSDTTQRDYAAFCFSALAVPSLLRLSFAFAIARQYRQGFALIRRSPQVHRVTAECNFMISPKKCSFKSMSSVENYFVVMPSSSLACLARSRSARFFARRSCCALYINHCDSNSCRRRLARLPSKNLCSGIGGGFLRMIASGSYCPDCHCGDNATAITATTRTIKGVPSIRTLTLVGSECTPIARSRASRLSSGDRSHPQLGQHSKKLGINASQPKHRSSVDSSDIETPPRNAVSSCIGKQSGIY